MEHALIVMVSMVAFRLAPIAIIAVGGWLALTRTTSGRALLARLHEGRSSSDDVLSLASEVERLKHDVADLQERLNYTERLVTEQRGALPSGSSPRPKTPPDSAAGPTY
jgi:hypothetical protein